MGERAGCCRRTRSTPSSPRYSSSRTSTRLGQAEILLGNDAGLAANLAWDLKRTDITVYASRANWQYGLSTPAGAGRFVSRSEVAAWIASARRRGNVALVLRVAAPTTPT